MADRFTPEQDQIILSAFQEAKEYGLPHKPVYMKLGDEFNRNPLSVQNRYKALLKKQNKGSKAGKGNLSEVDSLALKLKGVLRDANKKTEKTTLFKERYEAEKDAHLQLKKDYAELRAEYDKLITVVRSIVGEDEADAGEEEYEEEQGSGEGQSSFGFQDNTEE